MKILPILLSFSLLLCGCFTEASLTNNESAPDGSKVYFYLHDGSYVKSPSKQHHRVESSYQVSGTNVVKQKFAEKFEGVLQDSDIKTIGVERFNLGGTVLLVGGGALIVGGLLGLGPAMNK